MRVLLTSIGSSGDINPFIALGRELAQRGHEATVLCNPFFEASVRGAGLGYLPLGERVVPEDVARDMPLAFSRALGAWVLIRRWFAPMVPEFLRTLQGAIRARRPDVLVGHQISFGLPWVARAAGIPWATCVLAPGTMLSAHDPSVFPIGTDLTRAPMWYRRFAHGMARRSISFMLDVPLNRVRRELGLLAHHDTFWTEMFSGSATLGLWSPSFRPGAPDDPAGFEVCGFPWHDRSARYGAQGQGLDERLERFLDESEAPVVFTLGSVLSHQGLREFEAAVGACRRLGCRGVLVTGSLESTPKDLPSGVIAVDYAPYGQLMPRGRATVHHGGIGTTAQALRAGRPMIVVPFAHDQFDNGARAQRLGVGRVLGRGQATARGLARTLEGMLGDTELERRARALGAAIGAEDGAAKAAAAIEAIARAPGTG